MKSYARIKETVSNAPGVSGVFVLAGASTAQHSVVASEMVQGEMATFCAREGNNWLLFVGQYNSATNDVAVISIIRSQLAGVRGTTSPDFSAACTLEIVAEAYGRSAPCKKEVTLAASRHVDMFMPKNQTDKTLVADQELAMPFILGADIDLIRLLIYQVVTPVALSKARLGIREWGDDGLPGLLIDQTADIDTATSGYYKGGVIQLLKKYRETPHFITLLCNAAITVKAFTTNDGPQPYMGSWSNMRVTAYIQSVTPGWAEIPATFTKTAQSTYSAPKLCGVS